MSRWTLLVGFVIVATLMLIISGKRISSHSGSSVLGGWRERRERKKEEKFRKKEEKRRYKEEKLRRKAEEYSMKQERQYNKGNKIIGENRVYSPHNDYTGYNNQDDYNNYANQGYGNYRNNRPYTNGHYNNRQYSSDNRFDACGRDYNGNSRFREGVRPPDMYVPTMGDHVRDGVDNVKSGIHTVKRTVRATGETIGHVTKTFEDIKSGTVEGAMGAYDKTVNYTKKSRDFAKDSWDKSEGARKSTMKVLRNIGFTVGREFKDATQNIKDMKAKEREKTSKSNNPKKSNKSPEESSSDDVNLVEELEEFENEKN